MSILDIRRRVNRRRSILVSMATHRTPYPEAVASMREAMLRWNDLETGILLDETTHQGALMQVAHARSAGYVLANAGVEAVLFWDDDTVVPVRPDLHPILSLYAKDKDIIGGLYTQRGLPCELQAGYFADDGAVLRLDDPDVVASAEPRKIGWVGSGFMLVRRRVFERMVEAGIKPERLFDHEKAWRQLPGLDDRLRAAIARDDLSGLKDELDAIWREAMQYGTDIAFCRRAGDLGLEVWLDPSFIVGHVGSYQYSVRDWAGLKEAASA